MNDLQKQVGSAWDKKVSAITTSGGRAGPNWWNNTLVLRHVNRLVCGQPIKLFSAGCRAKLRDQLGYGVCLRRGVSIGCGTGVKEMSMIMDGLVECFDLYETWLIVYDPHSSARGMGRGVGRVERNSDVFLLL